MASGDTLIAWNAYAHHPPNTNFATIDYTAAPHPVLDFDDATSETAYFSGVMPGQYDGTSAVYVIIGWKFETYVGSQTCDWEAGFCRIDDDGQSINLYNFLSNQSVLATEAGTAGEIDYASISMTNAQIDGIQPNEHFVMRIRRDASGGTPSPGDAELAFVEIQLQ